MTIKKLPPLRGKIAKSPTIIPFQGPHNCLGLPPLWPRPLLILFLILIKCTLPPKDGAATPIRTFATLKAFTVHTLLHSTVYKQYTNKYSEKGEHRANFYLKTGNMQNPLLNFSAINCNSLNMSASTKKIQKLKLYGITKLKSDIIFLSDVRMSNKNLISGITEVRTTFKINPYCSYNIQYNSSKNKRGVAILINTALHLSEIQRICDRDENFILLLLENAEGERLIIGSVYGPNEHDPNFFVNLKNSLRALGDYPIVLGGDWNCTYSTDPINTNIDCHQMINVPNERNSVMLHNLCDELKLFDPFRGLWPNKKDYTFIPKGNLRPYRSRIDYFIISESLFPHAKDCLIADSMQNKLFDHKAIMLNFRSNTKTTIRGPHISNFILGYGDTELIAKMTTIETYGIHLAADIPLPYGYANMVQDMGRVRALLRQGGPDPSLLLPEELTPAIIQNRQNCIQQAEIILQRYNMEQIQNLELSCHDDIFFETLINNIRNEVSGLQHFVSKCRSKYKLGLVSSLGKLKKENTPDFSEISRIENLLSNINQTELLRELEKTEIFEYINNEKITPFFLKLAKGNRNKGDLRDICQPDGTNFANELDRTEFIVNYYENIYSTPPDRPDNPAPGSIDDFLGEIADHPIVTSSKLTIEERNEFERFLSIHELDKAISECKNKSACGIDGINYQFLKKFWSFLRVPLLKYSSCCFERGSLTNSFKSAAIKLIPKKGATSNIKNWRPISLLNCAYKILSRAINNRLKTVVDKLTSRAQKGFTSSRQIQEVLINTIENIAYAKNAGKDISVLAIDQAKAFDSVKHSFLRETLTFFGFGPIFTNIIMTACTGRQACIISETGQYSRNFNLGQGTAQGDCPSPILFNLCNQILLFKLELDPEILSIYDNQQLHPAILVGPTNDNFRFESNRETNKLEAFADDATAFSLSNINSLRKIKTNLLLFGELSGLKCNFEKTSLMPIGNFQNIENDLVELGFTITDKITLLGIDIDKNLNFLENAHGRTIIKMTNIANYWSRFRLSLTGRINIAKTFLYSQMGYTSSILTPSPPEIQIMEQIIAKFVSGSLNLGKERLFSKPEAGGVGLFDIKNYIIAIQVSWIKKATASSRDNWRVDLHNLSHGNPLTLSPTDIQQQQHPILHCIANSFQTFRKHFSMDCNNYKKSYILNNPIFSRGPRDDRLLDTRFFRQNPPIDGRILAKTRFCDIMQNEGIKPLHEIIEQLQINLNLNTYLRLHGALTYFKNNLKNNPDRDTSIDIGAFLYSVKKGSKKFRIFLEKDRSKTITNMRHVKKFSTLAHVPLLTNEQACFSNSVWKWPGLPNLMREFIFKFNTNILPINTRLSHYVPGAQRSCNFCILMGKNPAPDETFFHLFYECDHTSMLLDSLINYFAPEIIVLDNNLKRQLIFGIKTEIEGHWNPFFYILFLSTNFMIWENRNKKRLISWPSLKIDIINLLRQIIANSTFFRKYIDADNFFLLCRDWERFSNHG